MGSDYSARRKAMAAKREKERRRRNAIRLAATIGIVLVAGVALVVLFRAIFGGKEEAAKTPPPAASGAITTTTTPTSTGGVDIFGIIPNALVTMPTPAAVDSTDVDRLGISKDLNINGEEKKEYTREGEDEIIFPAGDKYTSLEGVITFRGNNYRDAPAYGTATNVTKKKLEIKWGPKQTGSLGKWSGSGWTGQPLIVKWPEATRMIMNLNEDKKNKADLVEVIYATMDGKIYFYDYDDGSPTREPINIGQPFKGAGALDPRGYPIIYLGGGDSIGSDESGIPRAFIYSLIDGEKLYEFGGKDPFSQRSFVAWDSSPLVSENDTLIYPGENGILYTMKLNTQYDEAAGTLSMEPSEIVKMRYTNARHRENIESNNTYWLGMESSAVVWKNFLYITDNCGDLLCIDLNRMKVIWAQDTKDDTNCTPVFEIEEDGQGYIYISTSLHWTQDSNKEGDVPFMKVNASTGEIVQQKDYHVHTVDGTSGGMQATAVVGKKNISDLVIFNMSRTPGELEGMIYALDKTTFEERWSFKLETEKQGGYSWSSPIAVYDEAGNGYIMFGNTDGNFFLLDGATGEQLDKASLGISAIEASPAAYNNTIVVGTRGMEVYALELK